MAELKNIRIAISGIYDYAFEELPSLQLPLPGHGAPEWVEKKRVYKVYRPSTVLQAACSKFKLLPLTHHHPKTPVDGSNFRELALGYTGENPFVDYLEDKDEVGIRSTLLIYDDEALNAYDSGEVQLSPGYVAEFEWNKGQTPKGEEYDIVMKKITDVNHLALLPCGRGGSDAVVMDNAAKRLTIFDLVKKTSDGAPEGNDNASKKHKKQNDFERTSQGKVSDWFVDVAKQSGFDFSDYEHETTNQFESHVLNRHGKGKENDSANIPIEKSDFAKIKDIINAPDFVAFGVKRDNEDRVIYAKTFDDKTTLYFEEVLTGKKNKKLRGKTMFKRNDKVTGERLKTLLGSNRKNDISKMKIACPEVTDSSISRSNNGVGGQIQRQASNCKYMLLDSRENFKSIFDIVKNKKTLWSAPHAQTQQQDTALNYGAKTENKVLSDFARGECSKGLNDSIDDVFISDKEIKKAGVLRETASDDGTVHDERVADTTRVVSLSITDSGEKRKSIFEIVKKTSDGAPEGNDNASKDHVSKEENEANKKRVFGKEYKGYKGTDAINKLLKEKQGFIQNAFSRKDIGNIDVVYGEIVDPKKLKGYGLCKIFAKHPEMTPELISEIVEKGFLSKTYNGFNLRYGSYLVGLNKGYRENGKLVTTDNWIVTSFKNDREKENDAIASAGTFTSDTNRPGNPFSTEIIIIHTGEKRKSIFEIVSGTVFDRFK